MVFFRSVLAMFVGFVVTLSAWGQTNPVVVTATRTAQTVDASLAFVSVIEREQIEMLQPDTVAELFGNCPRSYRKPDRRLRAANRCVPARV